MIPVHTDSEFAGAVERRRRQWRELNGTARLWSRDGSLWTGSGEEEWLGWLDLERLTRTALLTADGDRVEAATADLADQLAGPPFQRCLLLGMGGSALGADLLWRALPREVDAEFIVLDTTDPREITSALAGVDPAALRVIAASKSGGTIETRLAFELLLDRLGSGAPSAALAITDPGSALEARARAAGVKVVFGHPDIGGRFSVLSAFGMAPAAVAGIDLEPLLASARAMAAACRRDAGETGANPGVDLGLLLAAARDCGRDKLYLHAPEEASAMVAWVEQLVAESLGKGEVLLLPVDAAGLPPEPRSDRLDIVLGSEAAASCFGPGNPGGAISATREPLRATVIGRTDGTRASRPHPPQAESAALGPRAVIDAELPADLGGEFFRWQFGTAVAGALLGLNPFDQPDVESSKIVTRRYVERMKAGDAPAPSGVVRLNEVSTLGLAQLLGTHVATFPDGGYAVISRTPSSRPTSTATAATASCSRPCGGALPASRVARRCWASGRASCTRPDRRTRGGPTAACSSRSPRTRRSPTFRYPAKA